jgi:hypothetical protein
MVETGQLKTPGLTARARTNFDRCEALHSNRKLESATDDRKATPKSTRYVRQKKGSTGARTALNT